MTSLHILLEARSAARRCWRSYEIDVSADLFGVWLVEMSYGRIGTTGRSKVRSFATAADAQVQVHACLRKRATAPRRIGVRYRLRRASRAGSWSKPGLENRLCAWFGGPDRSNDLSPVSPPRPKVQSGGTIYPAHTIIRNFFGSMTSEVVRDLVTVSAPVPVLSRLAQALLVARGEVS